MNSDSYAGQGASWTWRAWSTAGSSFLDAMVVLVGSLRFWYQIDSRTVSSCTEIANWNDNTSLESKKDGRDMGDVLH